jgi:DNA adenine methylase
MMSSQAQGPARPFIKWPGGKTRLLPEILRRIPECFNVYHEPFAGGAAVFFALRPKRAVLNDKSPEVANAYSVIKTDVEDLIRELSSGRYRNEKACYLKVRGQDPKCLSAVERAARFLYLNRTCFNGLWRVNKEGRFNVPFGDNPKATICDEARLRSASEALQGATILNQDFSYVEAVACAGDVVYMDPPYHPASPTASFTAYTEQAFSDEDQVRVASVAAVLARRGVKVIVSNSATPFICELYGKKGFRIEEVTVPRPISASPKGRLPTPELIITF